MYSSTVLNVDHFLAISCTDFNYDISLLSLLIVLRYRFSVFIFLYIKK